MSSNNGKFLDGNVTQINGATIGDPESASVTDIFGAIYIDRVVNEGNSHLHPSDWKRYRDDGWDIEEDCDENQIYQFTEYLNDAVLKDKIRFQPVVKESGLEFLDVKVHLRNGYLTPEIYSKETDSHEYLHPTSAHPPTVSGNNPYSVALRVRRNCSDREPGDSLFVKNLIQYKAYLLHSGYDEETIDNHFIRVAKVGRKPTLKPENRRNRNKNKKRRVYNFITSWDPMFPNIGKAIKKFAKILEEDEDCREVFPEGCFRIAYKRGHKNLKEMIAPSSFAFASHGDIKQRNHRDEIGYCKKCNKCGRSNRGRKRENDLNNCSVMEEGETFYSTVTKERYKIRQEIDCRSKNIIYLVSCRKCPMQGVGQRENFQARVSNYISHIFKRKRTCGIVKHFMETGGHSVNDFRIMAIVQLENPPRSKADLKKRLIEFEGYWQIKLQTIEPYGMNTILEYLEAKKRGEGRSFLPGQISGSSGSWAQIE